MKTYGTCTESSSSWYVTAAVRSSLSQEKDSPVMARLTVLNSTSENTCRYAKRCSHTWLSSHGSSRVSGVRRSSAKAMADVMKSIIRNAAKKITSRWKLAGSVDPG